MAKVSRPGTDDHVKASSRQSLGAWPWVIGNAHVPLRTPIAVTAAALAMISPCRAQEQETQALALLRASSAQSAIVTFCAKHFAIDSTIALRISQTARDVATKVLGEERSEAAFKSELARRFEEVKAVGEQQWCADQRVALAGEQVRIFRD